MGETGRRELDARMGRIDSLVQSLEGCPDARVREQTRELVGTLMEFHGAGLARILEIIGDRDGEPLQAIARDPLGGGLLLLHGLHPQGLEARVQDALAQVRPMLGQHQGDVELLEVRDGMARLRLKGTCNGCPSSTTTFRNLIESAIRERAPEIERIEVEGLVAR